MRTRFALAAFAACIAVLAIAGSAQASTCAKVAGSVVVYMPGLGDSAALHVVDEQKIYNNDQWCGGTVGDTDSILVHDTTANHNGDNVVVIDLSGGELAPGVTDEGPGGVSEIEISLYLYYGRNTVLVTGSGGADHVHAGYTLQGGKIVRGINLNAGAEQGKVSDADVTYVEAGVPNAPGLEPIFFDGGEGDDTFDASGGAGFDGTVLQPMTLAGGNGNDHLVGGGTNDEIHADPGNDVIDGWDGPDTVTYKSSPGPASVDLSNGAPQGTGPLGTDQIARVEHVEGSPYDDALTGTDGDVNLIQGRGGDDVLTGRGGPDTLDGGPGSDTASYHEAPAGATQGVTVNLGVIGAQNTRGAGADELIGVENLAGSPLADELTGDDQPNTITGWDGEDSLRGKGGDDHFEVRDGTRDLVTCGLGVDTVEADVQPLDSMFGDCETSVFAPYVPPGGDGSGGSGGGGGATGTASGGATAPAKASFAGSKSSIRVDRQGRFRFSFHASAGLTGKAAFRRTTKRLLLAQKSFTAPAGGQATLKMKLSAKSLRILKRSRRVRTRVTVSLKNAAGLTSSASKTITLRAPKRPA